MSASFLGTRAARVLAPREAAIGDRLPYLGHLDEMTLLTRHGLLMQTIHLRGFPFETASDDELNYCSDAPYFHYVSNETVEGLQFHRMLGSGGVPRICDMSSDFLCRPIQADRSAR